MDDQDAEFLKEVWGLYGVGVLVLLLRFATRLKTVGIKGFQADDYWSILILAFFTMDAATVHIIYYTGTNVEASVVQKTRKLTATEIERYTFGSKEQLAAWYSYTALIWSMKATMIAFFNRLFSGVGSWEHKFLRWLAIASGLAYVAVVLTVSCGCYPIQKNWQVTPDPGDKCTLKLQNFLVTVVLNVITDAAILVIPLTLLWKLQIPLQQKVVIVILLSSGVFVIAAAIIRVVLTLGSNPSALNINRWGVRETIVGIVTINLPILKPLFNKTFWSISSFKSTSHSQGTGHQTTSKSRNRGPYELSSKPKGTWSAKHYSDMSTTSVESIGRIKNMSDSEELIIQEESKGVTVETTIHVMREDLERGPQDEEFEAGGGINRTMVHAKSSD